MKKYSTLAFTAIALGYAIGASAIHSGAHAQGAQIEDMKIEDMKIDDMQIDDAQIKEGKTKDARVRTPTKLCNSECLAKQIDTLNQKVEALERTVGALVIEANKSIKAGQKIILRTDPGMRGGKVKSQMISRREAFFLLGLAAALGFALPAEVLTASDAEAQAQTTAPAPTGGTVGMQR
ncbi:MAG: hypothetical protein WBO12_00185, partial [Xanthobacteraceae bacterium]